MTFSFRSVVKLTNFDFCGQELHKDGRLFDRRPDNLLLKGRTLLEGSPAHCGWNAGGLWQHF